MVVSQIFEVENFELQNFDGTCRKFRFTKVGCCTKYRATKFRSTKLRLKLVYVISLAQNFDTYEGAPTLIHTCVFVLEYHIRTYTYVCIPMDVHHFHWIASQNAFKQAFLI